MRGPIIRTLNVKRFFQCFIVVLIYWVFCINFSFYYNYDNPTPDYFQVAKTRGVERKYEFISECNCSRQNYYYVEGNATPRRKGLMSSCSDPGTFFQPSQKVVSYSLHLPPTFSWENGSDLKSIYLQGIVENLKTMRLNYPNYTMRLYTDVKIDEDFCPLICHNFWCDIRRTPMHGNQIQLYFMVWRFLPLGDPTVDHFLSRDLDSILSEREAAVVKDWLRLPEKKGIHLMRDKKIGHNTAILGGMWGASNSILNNKDSEAVASLLDSILVNGKGDWLNNWITDTGLEKGFDQFLLMSVFQPFQKDIVAYDSYHCEESRYFTLVKPFPIKRKNNSTDFVGNVDFGRAKYSLEKCLWNADRNMEKIGNGAE